MPAPPCSPRRRKRESTPPVERRADVRYSCVRECLARPEVATGVGDWSGIFYNLSAGGMGLALPCPLGEGTVLVIHCWRQANAQPIRARVVRSSARAFLWFHGCELLGRLSEEELQRWLR
jgi:hypothetical protein